MLVNTRNSLCVTTVLTLKVMFYRYIEKSTTSIQPTSTLLKSSFQNIKWQNHSQRSKKNFIQAYLVRSFVSKAQATSSDKLINLYLFSNVIRFIIIGISNLNQNKHYLSSFNIYSNIIVYKHFQFKSKSDVDVRFSYERFHQLNRIVIGPLFIWIIFLHNYIGILIVFQFSRVLRLTIFQ